MAVGPLLGYTTPSCSTLEVPMAAGSAFTISRIGQVAVNVHDLEAASAFYRDTLGLPFLFAAANKMAFFQCGDVRLMLVVPDKPEFDHPSSVIYYTVDDIQRAYEGLTARGARFEGAPHRIAEMPTHDLWMTFLRDPDRNLLALMSEVQRI
jgi:methylmalonyl-CoA/ethylmalonyl-CoA epimerase